MSFLNLDEERARKEEESRIAQQPQILAEDEAKSDAVSLIVICGIVGLLVGYNTDPDKLFTPAKLGATVGTAIALLLFSGIAAFISNKIFGKWKLVFIIVFALLATSMAVSYLYEKEKPKYYQR